MYASRLGPIIRRRADHAIAATPKDSLVRRKALLFQALVPWFLLQGLAPVAFAQSSRSGAPPPVAIAPVSPSLPTPPSLADALPPSARASYDSARLLFGDADYSGALIKFKQAYDEAKDARLLWNMASCEEKLRHYSKASALLTRYLAEAKGSLTAQDQVDAYQLIQTLAGFTAQLVVTSDQAGVDIAIDGEPAGTTPLAAPVVVDQGSRRVVAKKVGYEDLTNDVAVNGGVPASLALAMVKIVHEGRLHVHASAGQSILVDGSLVGAGDWEKTLPSGGHTLRVTADGKRPYQSEVVVQDRQTRSVEVTLEDVPHSGSSAWAWITGAVLVVGGAAVGGYFLFKPTDTPGTPTTIGTVPGGGIVMAHTGVHR